MTTRPQPEQYRTRSADPKRIHVGTPQLEANARWLAARDAGDRRRVRRVERLPARAVVARAIEQEPGDAEEFLTRVSQQAAHGLFGALEDRQPNLSRTVVEEAAKTAVGFVPFVGPFDGGVVSVGEVAAEKLHGSRSGIAAIMRLRHM